MIQRALAGEKFTEEQWQQSRVDEMTARAERYIKHLRDLEDPSIDPEPCGSMLCSCRPEFRQKRMK
jgi:hypothetical protein